MPDITRSRSVLRRDQVHPGSATFVTDLNDTDRFKYLTLDRNTWDALGSPDEITVSVEIGNTLEEEGS